SEHPLKRLRSALRVRVDCSLSELGTRRDGDWVTLGGMITQAKRIRTKRGDPMMFLTLDDLEGSVEVLLFGKALAASEDAVAPDSIVLVRGKLDHKDREKTCLVAQQVEQFNPSPEELLQASELETTRSRQPGLLRLRLAASSLREGVLSELREVLAGFPGESEVLIELATPGGRRRLRLGPEFRVSRGAGLHAELAELLGEAMIEEDISPDPPQPEVDGLPPDGARAVAPSPDGETVAAVSA
ncbi:MAG TPA: OB-fold nucleic acid binding domain-containing protein, partial [Solirubrobacteraceae bacterium]|nr:OB-fold nucleic acid binding domain-containing protein [Solirubrobacteraceae bacterium]